MEGILKRIIEIRKANKLSQNELAKSLVIGQAAYAKIEAGKSPLTVERLFKIAELLNVSVNELLGIEASGFTKDVISKKEEEFEKLNKEIEKKDELIIMLKNEKSHIKEHLVMQMISNFSSYVGSLDDLIEESKEENIVQKLVRFRKNTVSALQANKNVYINTGFLTQSDFDNHYKEMEGMYRNIPEF